jgi:hypothetical protein
LLSPPNPTALPGALPALKLGKEKPQVLSQASTLLHKYHRLMERRLGGGGGQLEQGAVEGVDDGPAAQRACFDRHPQCEMWRDKVGDGALSGQQAGPSSKDPPAV